MVFVLAIAVVAALLGAIASVMFKTRPYLPLAGVAFLPPLLMLVRYLTFVRSHDWEGMRAVAGSILSVGWILISFGAGAIVLKNQDRGNYRQR
jgi:hypothetical protein